MKAEEFYKKYLQGKKLLFFIIILLFALPSNAQKVKKVDYLIRSAKVYDGTESNPTKTDVGIKGEKIVYLGDSDKDGLKAKEIIEAEGLYLTPGFIDPHSHNDRWLKSEDRLTRRNLPSLVQGVTTIFVGLDGAGTYEVDKEMKFYESEGIGTNVAVFVGLSPVREAILGNKDVTPDTDQLQEMRKLIAQAMEEGAFGFSTGLYYAPQTYAATDEIIALAEEAYKYGGIYDTHMRSESNELVKAVEETIQIGKETGIPLMISHIKALGPAAWGNSEEVIELVEKAQQDGMNIFASQYPYTASHTSLKAMTIPSWAQSGGNKEMVARLKNPEDKLMSGISKLLALRGGDSRITISHTKEERLIGKSLHDIASEWHRTPEEAILQLLIESPNTSAVSYSMDEEDVDNFMKLPWVITCSDGGGRHPRAYGAFVRKIREYSLDTGKISLEKAIYSATGQTAELLGVKNRGFIKEEYFADLVLFDPDKIKDEATFEEPELLATGVKYVFVNGKLSVKDGKPSEDLHGKTIRHKN